MSAVTMHIRSGSIPFPDGGSSDNGSQLQAPANGPAPARLTGLRALKARIGKAIHPETPKVPVPHRVDAIERLLVNRELSTRKATLIWRILGVTFATVGLGAGIALGVATGGAAMPMVAAAAVGFALSVANALCAWHNYRVLKAAASGVATGQRVMLPMGSDALANLFHLGFRRCMSPKNAERAAGLASLVVRLGISAAFIGGSFMEGSAAWGPALPTSTSFFGTLGLHTNNHEWLRAMDSNFAEQRDIVSRAQGFSNLAYASHEFLAAADEEVGEHLPPHLADLVSGLADPHAAALPTMEGDACAS